MEVAALLQKTKACSFTRLRGCSPKGVFASDFGGHNYESIPKVQHNLRCTQAHEGGIFKIVESMAMFETDSVSALPPSDMDMLMLGSSICEPSWCYLLSGSVWVWWLPRTFT